MGQGADEGEGNQRAESEPHGLAAAAGRVDPPSCCAFSLRNSISPHEEIARPPPNAQLHTCGKDLEASRRCCTLKLVLLEWATLRIERIAKSNADVEAPLLQSIMDELDKLLLAYYIILFVKYAVFFVLDHQTSRPVQANLHLPDFKERDLYGIVLHYSFGRWNCV